MMRNKKIFALAGILIFLTLSFSITSSGQRAGVITKGLVSKHIPVSNGPKGPVHGGESAVTDMILMNDGWVYGSTKATWGAQNCHMFRTDGDKVEHLQNITSMLPGQTAISDLCEGKGNVLIGCTSVYDEILDDAGKGYKGGHLFSYNPVTGKTEDFGIIAAGQGINCIAVDSVRGKIFGVTYPAGHLFSFDLRTKTSKDFGEIMPPWRVKDLGRVSWRGVPKVLMIDDAGSVYYSTYYHKEINMTSQEIMKGGSSSYSAFSPVRHVA